MKTARSTVLVLGAYGFIGRYTVRHLQRLGAKVLYGTRGHGRILGVKDRRVIMHRIHSEAEWAPILCDVDAVINCVGILRERPGETYEDVHHKSVALLARACTGLNIRLVHVSALGLDNPVTSTFSLTKKYGEEAIEEAGGDWHIVRASLVDAKDGYGASWFRLIAKWPVHIAPANAVGGFSPVSASDLAEILSRITLGDSNCSGCNDRIYEVGCGKVFELFEYLELLAGMKPKLCLRLPVWFARLGTWICDRLKITPLTFGHYELLQYRNAPVRNRAEELLGRPPESIRAV